MEINIADLFEAVVDTVGSNEALVCASTAAGVEVRWSYDELEDQTNRMANLWADLGIGAGDHVGLHLHNGWPYIVAMLGLFKLRAVPVNVNYRYVADELRYLFDDADLVGVMTEPSSVAMVEGLAAELPGLRHVVVAGDDLPARLAASSASRPAGPRSADDLYLLYTGGTTGMPKGVMWRQEDIYFASLGGRGTRSKGIPPLERAEDIVERVRTGDPIMRRLPLCPLMHGGAMWVALQTHLNGGSLIVSTDRHFDAAGALRLMADERVELIMIIGDATGRPMADELASAPEGTYDLAALQVVASGGAILSPAVKAALVDAVPHIGIIDTFGASESGGQGRLRPTPEGSAPRLLTDADSAVLDDDGRPVAAGGVGRLARSGYIPLGYYKDPVKTAATFPVIDGRRWSVPGDLARVEDDGTITLLGRGAMSINTGGEKVFPEEVEGAIKSHPGVFDALVVGLPDERFGQRVVAVVALRPDALAEPPSDEELAAHARTSLAGYKVPRAWVIVEECRRSPTGKPDYPWAKEVATSRLAQPADLTDRS
jgi:acyl-CoA synthetase (AMP-forming)/AMP-acid ligase II